MTAIWFSLLFGVSGVSYAYSPPVLSAMGRDTIAGYSAPLIVRGAPNEICTIRVEDPNGKVLEVPAETDAFGEGKKDLFGMNTKLAGRYSVSAYYRDYASELPPKKYFIVYPDSTSSTHSSVLVYPSSVDADGEEPMFVKVVLRDQYSNPIADHLITLISSRNNDEILEPIPGEGTDDNGEKVFAVTSEEAGISYFTVIDRGTGTVLDPRPKGIFFELDEEIPESGGNLLQANIFGSDEDEASGPIAKYKLEFADANGVPNRAVVGNDANYFTVTAVDAEGRTVKGYTGSIAISTTDSGAVLPNSGEYNFRAEDKGSFQFSLAFQFSEVGKHTITVMEWDASENQYNPSIRGETEVEVVGSDITPPCEPYPECLSVTEEIEVKTPLEGSTYATSELSVNGKGPKNSDLRVILDDIEVDVFPADQDGVFFGTIPNVSDGVHTFYVQQKDGDRQISQTITFTVDTLPPTIDSITLTPKAEVEPKSNVTAVIQSEPGLSDATLVIDDEQYSFEEKNPGNYEASFAAPLLPEKYAVDIILEDAIGNKSTFLTQTELVVKASSAELPSFPKEVKAEAKAQAVSLSWKKVSSNITIYTVYMGTSEYNLEEVMSVSGNESSALVEDLEPGKEFVFSVTATDSLGQESIQSETASARPLFEEKPFDGPDNLRAKLSGDDMTDIELSWDEITGHDSKIVLYTIHMGVKKDNLKKYRDVSGAKTTYAIRDLDPGETYYFGVIAVDIDGKESSMSDILSATGGEPFHPAADRLHAEAGNSSVSVSWDKSDKDPDSYIIRYGVSPGRFAEEVIVPRSESSIIIRDLINDVPYYFTVIAWKAGKTVDDAYGIVSATPNFSGLHPLAEPPLDLGIPKNSDSGPLGVFILIGLSFLLFSGAFLVRSRQPMRTARR